MDIFHKILQRKPPEGNVLFFHPSGEYYFDRGIEAYDRYDLQLAEKYLRRGAQLEPDKPFIAFQLAVIYTEQGKYKQSNELLKEIMPNLDEEVADGYYFIANNYAYMGLFDEAYRHASHYLDVQIDGTFKKDAEELLELLSFEVNDGFFGDDDLIIQQESANELLTTGAYAEVIVLLNELIEQYPHYWPAYNNLALAYFYTGKKEKAASLIEFVLEKNAGNLHALCNKLILLHDEGYEKEANDLGQMLGKVKPMLGEHQFKLGSTFVLVERYEQAYELLRTLQKYDFEEEDSLYYWLAYAAYFSGREHIARSVWKKAILIEPERIGQEPWNDLAPRAYAPQESIHPLQPE